MNIGNADHIRPEAKPGKYYVPPAAEWDPLLETVQAFVADRELVAPMTFDELAGEAGRLLEDADLDGRCKEFLIVLINNELWREVVAAIPHDRRTLLLPPCLRSSKECQAEFDEYGLLCEQCGACSLGAMTQAAEDLGYAVLVAEGTSIVGMLLEQGTVDAVIGVSCMPSLERTFPQMANQAVPGLAVPLLKEGCENTEVLESWVYDFIRLAPHGDATHYLNLNGLRQLVQSWFAADTLAAVLAAGNTDTETISIDWLAKSGKRWRPFLTSAVYQAFCNEPLDRLPDNVRQTAIAVECIHKASLVYDDIQDDDARRYGDKTLHEEFGVPVALTAALFLLGQGYRLIAACDADPETVNDMVQLATEGHCELCLGQGGELWWMRHPTPLTDDEVLDIFRYKTAPSFAVVFRLGAYLGGATEEEHAILTEYSTAVGIAYQIQDDLHDFQRGGDVDDIKKQRPSIVSALAHDRAAGKQRQALADAWCRGAGPGAEGVRCIIAELQAETAARELLDHYKAQALTALHPLRNRKLKILLHRILGKLFK